MAHIFVHDRSATARSWKSFSIRNYNSLQHFRPSKSQRLGGLSKGLSKWASSCRASMLYLWGIYKKHGISCGYKKWWRHDAWFLKCGGITECVRHRSHVQICLRLDFLEVTKLYSGGYQIWNGLCRLYICMVQKVRTAGRKTRATNVLATCCTNFRAGVSQECTRKRPLTQDMWHWKPTHHWWAKHPASKMHVLIARFRITLLAKFWIFQAKQILETPTGLKVRTKWHLPRPKKWLDAVLGWRQGNNKETKRNNDYRTTRDIQRLVILVRIRIAVCLCGCTNT